jgi:hypothetical protein
MKQAFGILALALVAGSANAAIVANTLPGALGLGANPGPFEAGGSQQIIFDDVAIAGGPGLQIEITRVTVSIRINPLQPATSFDILVAETNGLAPSFDGALLRPFTNLGTVNIPANLNPGPGNANVQFSVGDGVTPMATLDLDSTFYGAGFTAMAIGVQFATNNGAAGRWNLSSTAGGDGGFVWFYDPDVDTAGGVTFGQATGDHMAYRIEGNLIPTPSAMALMGLGGLLAARRRR